MKPRFDWMQVSPGAVQALFKAQAHVNTSTLEPSVQLFVKLRASQINGCAYCIDMHTKDARAAGETEQRLYLLGAWREAAHLYSARELAALAWTEAVTLVADGNVPDDAYDTARAQFDEPELVTLTVAVSMINAWNRMNVAFRREAGGYQPGMYQNVKPA